MARNLPTFCSSRSACNFRREYSFGISMTSSSLSSATRRVYNPVSRWLFVPLPPSFFHHYPSILTFVIDITILMVRLNSPFCLLLALCLAVAARPTTTDGVMAEVGSILFVLSSPYYHCPAARASVQACPPLSSCQGPQGPR